MSYFVAVGFVILLVVLVVALDGTLALMAIDRRVIPKSKVSYLSTDVPIRF